MHEACDVNEFLGSWGPQPSDTPTPLGSAFAEDVLAPADWTDLAERWLGFTVDAIRRGSEDEAAWRAAWVVRYCRLAGG